MGEVRRSSGHHDGRVPTALVLLAAANVAWIAWGLATEGCLRNGFCGAMGIRVLVLGVVDTIIVYRKRASAVVRWPWVVPSVAIVAFTALMKVTEATNRREQIEFDLSGLGLLLGWIGIAVTWGVCAAVAARRRRMFETGTG